MCLKNILFSTKKTDIQTLFNPIFINMGQLDKNIFGSKKFSDILEEIYNNQKKKEEQISTLISELKPLIQDIGDATLVVPLLKEYLEISVKLSPKILIVNSNSILSCKYHHRRAEIWRIYSGEVGIIRSNNDYQNPMETFKEGDQIHLKQGERHRLIGLKKQGLIAEIWLHTDPDRPSDEEDIVRVQDDFGR